MRRRRTILAALAALGLLQSARPTAALERVLHTVERQLVEHAGEIVLEDRAGGVVLRTPSDQLHVIPAAQVRNRSTDDRPFELLDAKGLAEELLKELPADFRVHHSKNYVVCYNTTAAYAKWCSSLLERLQKGFVSYWKKRGCEVAAPQRPLPVIVFSDEASYLQHAVPELGASARNVIGYYSMATNRIIMYDLTGAQAVVRGFSNSGSRADIVSLLTLPAAEPLVATIVHEATHQISFNCGLQKRFADNPVWMSEGLAEFFETPDLRSTRGWAGIGEVNSSRWELYQANEAAGRLLPFEQIVGGDDVFRNPQTAVDAYAQAWALTYFLVKWRQQEYVAYLQAIAAKPQLVEVKPAARLEEFRKHFGDLQQLESEFQRQMSRIR
ncbi:MAG: DUF1570 domain-containing protein [Pirellulales bacterium]|nr:DUF1570 domain-containing protein [Pirellulales bacterium]